MKIFPTKSGLITLMAGTIILFSGAENQVDFSLKAGLFPILGVQILHYT
jgi:hypothetical protein